VPPEPHIAHIAPITRWRALRRIGGVATLGLALGCGDTSFACIDDGDCRDGSRPGTCEPVGYCSFVDASCASGRRFGSRAEPDLADACVIDDVADGSASESGTTVLGEPEAYGPCDAANDCVAAEAACVNNGANRMCAPPCTEQATRSTECPASADGAANRAGCLFTDAAMDDVRCFVVCEDDTACPTGMICAAPVCTWAAQ